MIYRTTGSFRRVRFFFLEKLVLPLVIMPVKAWMWTWRIRKPDQTLISEITRSPRLVLVTYHGMFLQLLAFSRIAAREHRRLVVMLSPSLDGRLLAAFLRHFDIGHVQATTNRRGVAGSRELLRRLAAGDIGVVAVDGPRGPCCMTKPGALRLARTARADIALAVTSANRGVTFGSWDRSHLPAPFARVELALVQLAQQTEDLSEVAELVQQGLVRTAQRMGSPTLPASLIATQGGRLSSVFPARLEQSLRKPVDLTRPSTGGVSRSTVPDGEG